MIPNFETDELRSICTKRNVALDRLGTATAVELARALSDIVACDTASEFFELNPHAIVTLNETEKLLILTTGAKVKLCSGHPHYPDPPPMTIDWQKITRIRIMSIEQNDV